MTLPLKDIIYREDLYPRIKADDDLLVITLRFLTELNLDVKVIDKLFSSNSTLKNSKYRNAVLSFFDKKCFICRYSNFIDIHHVKHSANGGSDRIDNLIILCSNHHKEWHFIENTFSNGTGGIEQVNERSNRVLKMDWQIPNFVMTNNVSPFFIQLAQKVNEQ